MTKAVQQVEVLSKNEEEAEEVVSDQEVERSQSGS